MECEKKITPCIALPSSCTRGGVDVFGLRRSFRLLQLAERAKTREEDGDEDRGGSGGSGGRTRAPRSKKGKKATRRNGDQPINQADVRTGENVSFS